MLAEVVLHRMVCRGGVFVTKPGFAPLKKEGCGVPKQAQKHGFQRQNRVRQVQWPVWSETSVQTFEFCSLKCCGGHFVQNKGCSKLRSAKWSLDWPIRLFPPNGRRDCGSGGWGELCACLPYASRLWTPCCVVTCHVCVCVHVSRHCGCLRVLCVSACMRVGLSGQCVHME